MFKIMIAVIFRLTLSSKCVSLLKCMLFYNLRVSVIFPRSMVTERLLQFGIRAKVLQFGIRAKVSSLDGPVEWSLDRGCEEKLCLEDRFRTLECSRCVKELLDVLTSSGGIAVL
jgi:hypothetical protein